MGLKACKECGQQVSTNAETCPHCGVKNPARPTQYGCGTGCLALIAVVVVIGVVASLSDSHSARSPSTSSSPTASSSSRGTAHYARHNVNVRKGPGTQNPVAYSMSAGDVAYLGVANRSGWAPVHSAPAASDTVGWVKQDLLVFGTPPPLLLVSWKWESGSSYEPDFIVGEVKNLTGHSLRYVQITCTLFDSQNRQVGSTLDNTTNLAADGVWRFRAVVTEDSATKYRCENPTGY